MLRWVIPSNFALIQQTNLYNPYPIFAEDECVPELVNSIIVRRSIIVLVRVRMATDMVTGD